MAGAIEDIKPAKDIVEDMVKVAVQVRGAGWLLACRWLTLFLLRRLSRPTLPWFSAVSCKGAKEEDAPNNETNT